MVGLGWGGNPLRGLFLALPKASEDEEEAEERGESSDDTDDDKDKEEEEEEEGKERDEVAEESGDNGVSTPCDWHFAASLFLLRVCCLASFSSFSSSSSSFVWWGAFTISVILFRIPPLITRDVFFFFFFVVFVCRSPSFSSSFSVFSWSILAFKTAASRLASSADTAFHHCVIRRVYH